MDISQSQTTEYNITTETESIESETNTKIESIESETNTEIKSIESETTTEIETITEPLIISRSQITEYNTTTEIESTESLYPFKSTPQSYSTSHSPMPVTQPISQTPFPIISNTSIVFIYYGEKSFSIQGNYIYINLFSNFSFSIIPKNTKSVIIYLMKNMNKEEYLSLNKLKHNIDLSFIGIEKIYKMNFDISEITNESKIDILTFNHVNLELLNQPTTFTKIKIKKLIFIDNVNIYNYKQFQNINLNGIIIEYCNIKMFFEFQKIYQYINPNNKPKETIIDSKDIKSINITSTDIIYNDEINISYDQEINFKVENDFQFNVNEQTTNNKLGKINFEFDEKNAKPEIIIPNEKFSPNFSFGVIFNDTEAKFKFNTNNLPIEIKGSGNIELFVPIKYNQITIQKPCYIYGEMLLKVLNDHQTISLSNISVKRKENILKNSISTIKNQYYQSTLLSEEDYTMINIKDLEVESKTKTEIISSNISNFIRIGNEAEIIFSGDTIISCPIEISYGIEYFSIFDSFITFNTNLDNFKPTKIILNNIKSNEVEHFNIIKSTTEYFSYDKCHQLLSIIINNEPNLTFQCINKYENNILEASITKNENISEKSDSSGFKLIICISCCCIIIIIVLVILITILHKRRGYKNKFQKKYKYEDEENELFFDNML